MLHSPRFDHPRCTKPTSMRGALVSRPCFSTGTSRLRAASAPAPHFVVHAAGPKVVWRRAAKPAKPAKPQARAGVDARPNAHVPVLCHTRIANNPRVGGGERPSAIQPTAGVLGLIAPTATTGSCPSFARGAFRYAGRARGGAVVTWVQSDTCLSNPLRWRDCRRRSSRRAGSHHCRKYSSASTRPH